MRNRKPLQAIEKRSEMHYESFLITGRSGFFVYFCLSVVSLLFVCDFNISVVIMQIFSVVFIAVILF